jgi:ABC-type Fe3+-siderophore transport system permease subunit
MDRNTKVLLRSLLIGAVLWIVVWFIVDDRALATIYNYQTLIAAGIALIGAFVTVYLMSR